MDHPTGSGAAARVLCPIMLDLAGREVLVVGAGAVAERRVDTLLEGGAHITVVAPAASAHINDLADAGLITQRCREFAVDDVNGTALVFTATGNPEVDGRVAAAARRGGAFVNSADDDANCDFHMPAVARRGLITIAVGTAGAAPALAARLRDRFAASLGPEWARFAEVLRDARSLARERLTDSVDRMRTLAAAANDDRLLSAIARGDRVTPEDVLSSPRRTGRAGRMLDRAGRRDQPSGGPFVSLVGAGPGATDLLTQRACDRLSRADVVVYDDLVDRSMLALAPDSADLVYCGKRGWRDDAERPGPEVLVARALEAGGQRVVRLKGGDPNVFGRSGEEIAALEEAGVPFEVVPGVTSALAAAAAARIPLTQRGVAGAFTVATGVSAGTFGAVGGSGDEPTTAEIASLARAGSTIVVYMGLRVLPELTQALISAGVPHDLPVAIVASASLPSERVVCATLRTAAVRARDTRIASPAVIIVGEVARSAWARDTTDQGAGQVEAGRTRAKRHRNRDAVSAAGPREGT